MREVFIQEFAFFHRHSGPQKLKRICTESGCKAGEYSRAVAAKATLPILRFM